MSLDKLVAYTAIIGALCAPPMSFFAAASFFQWKPDMFSTLGIVSKPMGVAIIALLLGVCPWLALGYTYHWARTAPIEVPPPSKVPTDLRLQFNGGDTLPLSVDQHNIWRWYALTTVFKGLDEKTKTFVEMGRTWTVFMTFDKPVNFTQIRIDASGGKLPTYEVKDSTNRSAVIVFGGDLTGVVVTVQAIL